MNIYRLVTAAAAVGVIVSGCASEHSEATSQLSPVAVADYSCEPRLDMNWPTDIPPDVAAAQEKSWSVTSVQSQGVVLTYYRDCGVDIRGPVTDEYPYGYLFGSLFCRGDGAMIAMMGNFEKDPSADQKLVTEVKRIMPELEASRNCAEKRITPVS